jgi:hypothetical protein
MDNLIHHQIDSDAELKEFAVVYISPYYIHRTNQRHCQSCILPTLNVNVAIRTPLLAILGTRGILVAREAASVVALSVTIGSISNYLGSFSVVVFENDFKDIEV